MLLFGALASLQIMTNSLRQNSLKITFCINSSVVTLFLSTIVSKKVLQGYLERLGKGNSYSKIRNSHPSLEKASFFRGGG